MTQYNMFSEPKIAVVGAGYVGGSIATCYSERNFQVICIDVDPAKSTGTYADIKDCEAVFVCVPSPSKENGECDTSILNAVLYLLRDFKNVIISKTTAPPAFYERMQTVYPNLVYVPEFLTAANPVHDFFNQDSAIIGGSVLAYQREAERILRGVQQLNHIRYTTIGEAALTKYILNSFLATKVVFMNEMEELTRAHGYKWRDIVQSIMVDKRVGHSHLQVPGPDGFYGFGGMCFPKDTNAFVKYANKLGVQLNVLKSALKKNTLLRLQKPK